VLPTKMLVVLGTM